MRPIGAQPLAPRPHCEPGSGRGEIVNGHKHSIETPDNIANERCCPIHQRGAGTMRWCDRQHRRNRIKGRREDLGRSAAVIDHVCLTPRTIEDSQPEWDVVEEFIGDDNTRQHTIGQRRRRHHTVGMRVTLRSRHFNTGIHERVGTVRISCRHRTCQGARARTHLVHTKLIGSSRSHPFSIKKARDNRTEQWPNFRRCDEVASAPRSPRCGVKPVVAVQGPLNEDVERNRVAHWLTGRARQ